MKLLTSEKQLPQFKIEAFFQEVIPRKNAINSNLLTKILEKYVRPSLFLFLVNLQACQPPSPSPSHVLNNCGKPCWPQCDLPTVLHMHKIQELPDEILIIQCLQR